MRPIISDLKWVERDVQTEQRVTPISVEQEQAIKEARRLADQNSAAIMAARNLARQRVRDLQDLSEALLSQYLPIDLTEYPNTQKAAKIIAGTHPGYRSQTPIEDSLTLDLIKRAYAIKENAGVITFGFDPVQAVRGSTGTYQVVRLGITTPEQAAGEVPATIGETTTLPKAIDQHNQTKTRNMRYLAFKMIVSFVLSSLANLIDSVVKAMANALTIKIVGKKIKLAGPITKPLRLIRDLLNKWARRLDAEADNYTPSADEIPERPKVEPKAADEDPNWDTTFDPREPVPPQLNALYDSSETLPPLNTADISGESGLIFLTSALQVIETLRSISYTNTNLQLGLVEYERSRLANTTLLDLERLSDDWGFSETSTTEPIVTPVFEIPNADEGLPC